MIARRHQHPVRGERCVALSGHIDEPVKVRPVLILVAQRGAVSALVVSTLHTVEQVADVEYVSAALFRLREVLQLKRLICTF